jgi:poly-gamma-glutamate capsule biosynthesis protein CapA/YwtB (metallophosphatase superfamily)
MSSIRLQAVGDITLHTSDGSDPFALAGDIFEEDAVLFGNLETALSDAGTPQEKLHVFAAPTSAARHLARAGFDVVSTANNHIVDAGPESLPGTLASLNEQGIAHTGAGLHAAPPAPTIIRRHGVALGFLAYCSLGVDASGVFVNGMDAEGMVADIGRVRELCDAVIVSLHWGIEYVYYPSPEQIETSRSLIDAGASVVLTHHPHVMQGIETYRDGLIAYSLGNFQFSPMREECHESFALSLTIEEGRVTAHDYLPVAINAAGQPAPMAQEDAVDFRRTVDSLSNALRAGKITNSWWFEEVGRTYLSENLRAFRVRIRRYGIRHACHALRWLVSRFVIRCFLGALRRSWRRRE